MSLMSGEIAGISRYNHVILLRQVSPFEYWFSIAVHASVAAIFLRVAITALRRSRWF
jgi:hypothetical protein